MACTICCENFNKTVRKPITCGYCETVACRSCVQRYLLDTTLDPHCMSCRKAWNREFVDMNCTRTFVNDNLKKHKQDVLFEREKCLLPASQAELDRRITIRNLYTQVSNLYVERRNNPTVGRDYAAEMREVQLQIHQLEGAPTTRVKKKFVHKCPAEKCRGFLSEDWNCTICKNNICSKCNEVLTSDHVCDTERVESFTLIKKDTKSCPGCGEMIFKISGCPQMWCPSCHTVFNWDTLEVETGVIHNPHYFEFQRRMNGGVIPRMPGDVPCGGRVHVMEMLFAIRPCSDHIENLFVQILNSLRHIEDYEVRFRFRVYPIDNSQLRILYLMNSVTETEFKKRIQEGDKRMKKISEIHDVFQMFVNTGEDIIRRLITERNVNESMEMFDALRIYVNESMIKISRRYNCVTPQLTPHYSLTKYR